MNSAAASPEGHHRAGSPPRGASSDSQSSGGAARSRKSASPTSTKLAGTGIVASITSFQLPDSVDHEKEQSYAGGHKQFLPLSIRNRALSGNRGNVAAATALQRDALEFSREPLPFQRQYFKSSTILKMVQVPRKHQGMFVDGSMFSLSSLRKKAMMLHSYRYQWDELLPEMRTLQLMSAALFGHPVRMAQRDRLGIDLDEALRLSKRERELLPHRREPRDLLLIGVQQLPYGDAREPAMHDMSAASVRGIVLPRSSRPVPRNRPQPTSVARISPAASLPAPSNRPRGPADAQHAGAPTIPQIARRGAGGGGQAARATRRPRQGSASRDAPPSGISSVALRLPKIGSSRVITLVSAGPSLQSEVPRPLSSNLSTASPSQKSCQDADDPEAEAIGDSRDNASEVDDRLQDVTGVDDKPAEQFDSEQLNGESEEQLPEGEQSAAEYSLSRQGTPHPLRGADISQYGVDHAELTKLFTKLDTDADGHLTYPQVRPHLAMGLSAHQEKFVKLVYDITSASTFFGVQEFIHLTCLCEEIRSHGASLTEAYKTLDFSVTKEIVMQSAELFDGEVDRSASSHVSIVALEDIVSVITNKEKDDAFVAAFGRMASHLKLDTEFSKLNKIGFIALIPQFLRIDVFYDSIE